MLLQNSFLEQYNIMSFQSSFQLTFFNGIIQLGVLCSGSIFLLVDRIIAKIWHSKKKSGLIVNVNLFNQLQLTFRALMIAPIFTSIIPAFFVSWSSGQCATHPVLNTLASLLLVTQPLVNAVTTTWFIIPYRRGFLNLITMRPRVNPFCCHRRNVRPFLAQHQEIMKFSVLRRILKEKQKTATVSNANAVSI